MLRQGVISAAPADCLNCKGIQYGIGYSDESGEIARNREVVEFGQVGEEPKERLAGCAYLSANPDVLKEDAPQALATPSPQCAYGWLLPVDLREALGRLG